MCWAEYALKTRDCISSAASTSSEERTPSTSAAVRTVSPADADADALVLMGAGDIALWRLLRLGRVRPL